MNTRLRLVHTTLWLLYGKYNRFWARARFFSIPQDPDRLWGPLRLLYNGYRGSFLGGKATGREVDHSSSSDTEVKNGGAIPPLTHTFSWNGS
jgi:hypothetical protein